MDKDELWETVSFVKRSEYRTKILQQTKEPKTPTELAKELNLRRPHVSRTLKELRNQELIELLNKDAKMGRLYRRTEKAEKILSKI